MLYYMYIYTYYKM